MILGPGHLRKLSITIAYLPEWRISAASELSAKDTSSLNAKQKAKTVVGLNFNFDSFFCLVAYSHILKLSQKLKFC